MIIQGILKEQVLLMGVHFNDITRSLIVNRVLFVIPLKIGDALAPPAP